MNAHFEVGDRVVCPDPDDGWFIGTVAHIDGVALTVTYSPTQVVRARAEEVRPVMPRGPEDLDKYGRWWWLEDRVVEVFGFDAYGNIAMYAAGTGAPQYLSGVHDWRGPVQPPPEVRS